VSIVGIGGNGGGQNLGTKQKQTKKLYPARGTVIKERKTQLYHQQKRESKRGGVAENQGEFVPSGYRCVEVSDIRPLSKVGPHPYYTNGPYGTQKGLHYTSQLAPGRKQNQNSGA